MRRLAAAVSLLAALGHPGPLAAAEGQPPAAVEFTAPFLRPGFLRALAGEVARLRAERQRREAIYHQESAGLLWARRDNGADADWYDARDHCRDLELGGWIDWRLPTLDELTALHERRSRAVFKLPGAITLTSCCPWSATGSGDDSAWSFNFRFRKPFSGSRNYSYQLRALCVRTPSTYELEELSAMIERFEAAREAAAEAAESGG